MERTMRGRLHRLRMGQIVSQGHRTFGYDYMKRSPNQPAALRVNSQEAPIVLSVYEMFASGKGICYITRWLEDSGIPTVHGKRLWRAQAIRYLLRNHTYTGIRYFNSMRRVKM